jgi:hypothetical protein
MTAISSVFRMRNSKGELVPVVWVRRPLPVHHRTDDELQGVVQPPDFVYVPFPEGEVPDENATDEEIADQLGELAEMQQSTEIIPADSPLRGIATKFAKKFVKK